MPDVLSRSATPRFFILAREKILLTIALNLAFWTGYSMLARYSFFPVREVPLTPLDHIIPFAPGVWTPVYLSAFIISFVVPWLIITRSELRNYVRGVLFMSFICFTVFLLCPTASPRPRIVPELLLYDFVLWMDGPLNAFPSLHAAFLVFTLCFAREILSPLRPLVWVGLWLWAGAILYATIATRQHYVADLLGGALIGGISHRLAWHGRKAPAAANASTFMNCASQSQDGAR